MPLELSLIAGDPVRFANHQTSLAAGVAFNAAQRQRWPYCPRTWVRFVETKSSSHASEAGRKLRDCRTPTIRDLSAQ
jgi:hypothetical protein